MHTDNMNSAVPPNRDIGKRDKENQFPYCGNTSEDLNWSLISKTYRACSVSSVCANVCVCAHIWLHEKSYFWWVWVINESWLTGDAMPIRG